jgi:hypothetical protein
VQYYVDDMPYREMAPGDINNLVTSGEVVAVEIYDGASTPGRFIQAGASSCTTIVLWTRFKIRGLIKPLCRRSFYRAWRAPSARAGQG